MTNALKLADKLQAMQRWPASDVVCLEAAAELRQLYEVNAELVRALEEAVRWGQPFKDAPRNSRPEWFAMANAALRKATGEQP